MRWFRLMWFVGICTILLLSCGKRRVQIDRETKRAIDTLAASQIQAMRIEMDSMCILRMDSLVAVKSDSVMNARREEMRKLLGR